jgi:hypothetical protein
MWKIKSLAITVVLLGVLAFGAVAVHAGWYWNSAINVEGVEVRTRWTVDGGADPAAADDYLAFIGLSLPKGASAEVVEVAANVELSLTEASKKYKCYANGIDARVEYSINPLPGSGGKQAQVTVTADGLVVGEATGKLGRTIAVDVFIAVDSPSCYSAEEPSGPTGGKGKKG